VFDVLAAAAVADELTDVLLDGRIQRVGLLDRRTLAAEVYAGGRRHALVASAEDRNPRIHLAPALPSLDPDLVTPFALLLRKYVRGGVIVGIEQPPLERLLRLSIAKRIPTEQERRARRAALRAGIEDEDPDSDPDDDESGDEGEIDATFVHLHVEIMGRHSNLILVDDDGRIMDAAKRVTSAMSRVRPIQPRLPYTPPPPLDRPDPRRLTGQTAADLLAGAPDDAALARWLTGALRGISPQMAKEIAWRTCGDTGAGIREARRDPGALARETRALLEPLLTSAWAPCLYRSPAEAGTEDEEHGEVVAWSAIPMAYLSATLVEEPTGSISAAISQAQAGDDEATPARHAQRRERLLGAIRAAREKQERKLAAVREQGAQAAEIETLRTWGELIYANMWQIQPGQAEMEADGVRVPLDPARPAKEVAQGYFERYRNAQRAEVHQGELEEVIAAEVGWLDQLTLLVSQAAGFAELEALAGEWEAHQPDRSAGRARKRPTPRRPRALLDDEGNAVFIGHTSAQNDQVTFEIAGPDDTWLHARGVPGSHVIIRWQRPGAEEREETVLAAAALAGWYSAGRDGARVEVDVARRRHVRKIKGGRPGMVNYRNERTIAVRPGDESGVSGTLRPTRES
jgi:predicted ribosome quality control (RQC) complex YloA/Tae2 family protein